MEGGPMEFFLDTADVDEIREIAAWGILDGVTTNPSLIKKSGRDFREVVREIAGICSGPISAEVTAMDTEGMLAQARQLKSELPENVIIKIPCTPEACAEQRCLRMKGLIPMSHSFFSIPGTHGPLKQALHTCHHLLDELMIQDMMV